MCMLCCADRIQAAFVFECGESKDGPCGMLGGAASRSAIMKATSEAILDAKQQRCQYKSSGQNAWQPLGQRHLLGFCNCCAAQAVHLSHISNASREYIGMRTLALLGYEKSSM